MATKVRDFGKSEVAPFDGVPVAHADAARPSVYAQAGVTSNMVDEAVDRTLRSVNSVDAEMLKQLWLQDTDTEVARKFFSDSVGARTSTSFAEMTKRTIAIEEVLSTDETAKLIEYAPEFNLVFLSKLSHDHGFFSSRRKIDHERLMSQIPPNANYLDIGGSVTYHVKSEHTNVLVVAPFDVDPKDVSRAALTEMQLRRISVDPSSTAIQRAMAASILSGEGKYVVSDTVQSLNVHASVSMSCHVYDIPLIDLVKMMDRCGVTLHVGCVHFSNSFYHHDAAEIPYSGAYYEIDRAADEFRMRVGKSMTWWYPHKWSHFMHYGANQVLSVGGKRFSYRIVSRKHDTIDFRISQVHGATTADVDQVYRLPDVPMVEVDGYEVFVPNSVKNTRLRSKLLPRKYHFPEEAWQLMLNYVTMELDRGGLSYDKACNYYRTIVPKQEINGVRISGGFSVPIDEIPALVVMAAAVGNVDAVLLQQSIRGQTGRITASRQLRTSSTLYLTMTMFWDSLVSLGMLAASPLTRLAMSATGGSYVKLHEDMLVTWRPQVKYVSLNYALVAPLKSYDYNVAMPATLDFRGHTDNLTRLMDLMRYDPSFAELMRDTFGDKVPKRFAAMLPVSKSVVSDVGSTLVPSSVGDDEVEASGKSTFERDGRRIDREVLPPRSQAEKAAERRLAIKEAASEADLSTRALLVTCARICREVILQGRPQLKVLQNRKEELFNADVWHVVSGTVVRSELHGVMSEVSHSGVYVPNLNELVPVREQKWCGPDAKTGQLVERTHAVIAGSYTGPVLVLDQLVIFNGPAIADTLRRAAALSDADLSYKLYGHKGPAGCGKTTTIVRDSNFDRDLYCVPTRDSVRSLREKLQEKGGDQRKAELVARTADSYCVNFPVLSTRAKYSSHVNVDEYVLMRAGVIYAVAALAGAEHVHLYGDEQQIQHVSRVEVCRLYVTPKFDVVEMEYLTHRMAAAILSCVAHLWDFRVRTTVKKHGTLRVVRSLSEVQWATDSRLLTMYQADKQHLSSHLRSISRTDIRVNTTHEAQGCAHDQIVLYNSEVRKRTAEDVFYLYSRPEYCLVALTRARYDFIYVCASQHEDLVKTMVRKSEDPRRVRACADVATQGESLEFL